jgi:sulfonate transport system substrate-binding protein
MSHIRNRTRLGALIAVLIVALLGVACGDDGGGQAASAASPTTTAGGSGSAGSGSTGSPSTTAAAPKAEPITIKFLGGSANSGIVPYAKKNGLFEKALTPLNAKVEWVDGPAAFSANLDAMKSGNITASQAAVSPIIGALIAGLTFKVFAIATPSTAKSAGIVAGPKSGIKSVKDLVGKKVAVNPAAHGEYILLEALKEAGIPFDQVQRVPIQPTDAAAAFASGSVDAWATFNNFFTTAISNGATVLTYESDLKSDDVGVFAASTDQLTKNPAAYKAVIDVLNQLIDEGATQPEKFQNIFQQSGPTFVSGELLANAIADTKAQTKYSVVTPEGTARVQGVLDIFVKAGVLKTSVPVTNVVFDLNAGLGK